MAFGIERVDECHKNSYQEQEVYEKKSKNNPFHCFDLLTIGGCEIDRNTSSAKHRDKHQIPTQRGSS
jgi:hypothetical protein